MNWVCKPGQFAFCGGDEWAGRLECVELLPDPQDRPLYGFSENDHLDREDFDIWSIEDACKGVPGLVWALERQVWGSIADKEGVEVRGVTLIGMRDIDDDCCLVVALVGRSRWEPQGAWAAVTAHVRLVPDSGAEFDVQYQVRSWSP